MKKPLLLLLMSEALKNRTGSWRTLRPAYVHKLPPCNNQCPAGEDIQGWLFYSGKRQLRKSLARHLTKTQPLFPACMGRVCYHTCEGACNRGCLDESVGINPLNASLATMLSRTDTLLLKPKKLSGKKVLLSVPVPPAFSCLPIGLKKGHDVTIKEGSPQAGGMMRYGIPKYRLPRHVLIKKSKEFLTSALSSNLTRPSWM